MGACGIKRGTKMQLAKETTAGQQPVFDMITTFYKELDESAFLVSVPMVDGKALPIDESQRFLFKYEEGEETRIVAGYVDDAVKEGIRRYWKIRRVTENRQFIKRADARMKVELPLQFMQDTWPLNSRGEIDKESGETMDISNNGLAVYMNRWFEVGESCIFTLPRLGSASEGMPETEVVGVICWMREMPKGGPFRFVTGVQLRFANTDEKIKMQEYVAYVKKRYKL